MWRRGFQRKFGGAGESERSAEHMDILMKLKNKLTAWRIFIKLIEDLSYIIVGYSINGSLLNEKVPLE